MPNPYNITVSDTSPLFQYLPYRDGPINTSWNATFADSSDSTWAPQSLGRGASSHRTSLVGASVRLDWLGTAIYLYGVAPPGGYTIRLDGTQANAGTSVPGLLFSQVNLNYGSHSLLLEVVQGTASISSAIITVGIGEAGTTIHNYSIPTTSVPLTADGIVLSGSWNDYNGLYGFDGPVVDRLATNTNGSSISFPLTFASAFCIIGHVNFDHGPYHVTFTPPADVGPPQVAYYNGSSRWVGLNTIKYLATGMDRTRTYQVEVVNDSGLYYDMSEIVVFDTPPSSSHLPSPGNSHPLGGGAIAGIVVGCTFLVFILSMFFVFWQLQKRRTLESDDKMVQYDSMPIEGAAALHSTLPTSRELPPLPPGHQDSMPPSSVLTPEDARFFNNLYSLNVPAADIATMMDTLRTERGAALRAEGSRGSVVHRELE